VRVTRSTHCIILGYNRRKHKNNKNYEDPSDFFNGITSIIRTSFKFKQNIYRGINIAVSVGKLWEVDHFEDLGLDGRTI
jgi:hypothetical protein